MGQDLYATVYMEHKPLPYLLIVNQAKSQHFSVAPLHRPEKKTSYPLGAMKEILARPSCQYVVDDAKEVLSYLDDVPTPVSLLCLSTLTALAGGAQQNLAALLAHIENSNMSALAALECAVIPPLMAIEKRGLPFDVVKWRRSLDLFATETKAIEEKLSPHFASSGGFSLFREGKLDWNNPDFIRQGLSEALDRPVHDVSASALAEIDHEAARLIILLRQKNKMLSAYGEHFLTQVTKGRLCGTYFPSGTVSGRITCQNPNLQALPQDDIFQECIQAESGQTILHFDFSGFELRILAAMANDREMIEIFASNQDIHSEVAKKIFNKPVSKQENPHLREYAKVINFGLIYGMGKTTIAQKLNISLHKAEGLLSGYFKRFVKINDFLLSQEHLGLKLGFIHTALNRRYYFCDGEDDAKRKRLARNLPIQGTGAEIIKMAICRVHRALRNNFTDARLINTVHDELVVECDEKDTIAVVDDVEKEMVASFASILDNVPVGVECTRRSPLEGA